MKKILLVTITSLAALISSAQVDLKKGLMMHLPFNGNTMDASINGNNAVNHGAVLTTDQWGRANSAYYFNGSSAFMQIANSPTLQPGDFITLSARVNVKAFYKGVCYNNCIIDKGVGDREYGNYTLRSTGSTSDCYIPDTNAQNYVGFFNDQDPDAGTSATTPHVSTGKWDCLIFTYDGSMAKMYVNGTLRHQYPSSSVIGTNSSDVFLGKKNHGDYPYWFNGSMDEVRIYNRALNTAEIDSLCSNALPLAIQEASLPKALPIDQNPVQSTLTMLLSPADMGGNFKLVDISGRILVDIPVLQNSSIPMNGIAPGFYLVDYRKEGKQMLAKIVKQ